jgi:PKD repeat protein
MNDSEKNQNLQDDNLPDLDNQKTEKDLEALGVSNLSEINDKSESIISQNSKDEEITDMNGQVVVDNDSEPLKRTKAKLFIIGSFLVGVSFVIIFYGLLLWAVLTGGNVSNPLFTVLGIEASELKSTLELITNSIFGISALVSLVSILLKIYLAILARNNVEKRKHNFIKIGISFLIFLTICGSWIGLFLLISNANTGVVEFDNSMIITNPQNVIGITTPISIEFNIGTQIYQKIDSKLIKQISWDFDDDGVFDASGPKVTHRFLTKGKNDGKYLVKVNVLYFSPNEKKDRNFVTTKEVIVANEAILGFLEADITTGNYPLRVKFSAEKSVDSDGEIVFYEWDLDGDGEYEAFGEKMKNTEKLYSKIGEYLVKLRVTGSNNDIDVVEKKITVTDVGTNLRAEINSSDSLEGFAPLSFTLDGSQSFSREGKIVKYEWYVEGENTTVSSRKIQRKFYEPGEYDISLTVENETGEKHKKTEIIKVKALPMVPVLEIKTSPIAEQDKILTGTLPFKVVFDASKSQVEEGIEWQWDFENDGIIDGFEPSIKHIFKKAGLFDVKLKVINSKNEEFFKTIRVNVEEIGTKAIIKTLPTSGEVPFTVRFDGSGSITDDGEIVDYIWEFSGQDPIHYGAQISYDFKKVGIFPIRLTILTEKGNVATTETIVSARSIGLKSKFSVVPEIGVTPLEVRFNPTDSSGMIIEYDWQFGDGETSREFTPTHIFKKPGQYEVQLKITDSKGVISESSKTITVLEK